MKLGVSLARLRSVALHKIFLKHKHVISLAGLFLVFATFVVKEGIRDHIRDQVSDLRSAEMFFNTRSDINVLSDKLDELVDSEPNAPQLPTPLALLKGIQQYRRSLGIIISRTWYVIDSIPRNESLETQISAYHERHLRYLNDSDDASPLISTEKARNQTVKVYLEGHRLQEELDDFSWQVFDTADKALESAEHWYHIATWFSYALYAVGWFIAFAGRLFGVEGAENPNE